MIFKKEVLLKIAQYVRQNIIKVRSSRTQIFTDTIIFTGAKDPDAVVSVIVDENGTLTSLLLVIGGMKDLFKMYPKIIFTDGTYSVNKLRMTMYFSIVEDGNGCGQSVGYSVFANEKTGTLEGVLGELGKIQDLTRVRVAFVDKALNEIAAIKHIVPVVTIQLCKFHVMQGFTRKIKKTPVDESTRNALTRHYREMVFGKSEESFSRNLG